MVRDMNVFLLATAPIIRMEDLFSKIPWKFATSRLWTTSITAMTCLNLIVLQNHFQSLMGNDAYRKEDRHCQNRKK